MSFATLLRKCPNEGKIKLKGGLTEGHVTKTEEKVSTDRYTPSLGKGSEYAAKYRAEDDKAFFESSPLQYHEKEKSKLDVSDLDQPEDLTSIGTIPNLRELDREELTQVYQQYTFLPMEPSEHLEPIFNERKKILQLIEMNPVCIIKGPTGCGKSTQIPQFILDSYVQNNQHCNIIVTQPRRIAAISLAQHVCRERKWEVGKLVGYQVALDKCVDDDTRLLYCTTGVLLEKLINEKTLQAYTHILLDEVHEREEDMDFVMLIVRKFQRTNSPNVKIVLMSATMDISRFADYFQVKMRNAKHPAPSFEIKPSTKFTVSTHYLDALKDLARLPDFNEDEPGISPEAYDLVLLMLQAFNKIDMEDYKHRRSPDEKGAVLIFLPGLYQIETLFDKLYTEDKQKSELKLWLCPLHSSITRDEQEKVRNYAPHGKRKVILSTNIAESSITIPDVKYVIDFCLTKHLVADPVTGFTSLQLAWASHTNCIQREGRVGRVQDGRVYRLVPKSFYQFKMLKECVPEMQRCPLDLIVLKCKRLVEDECPIKIISCAMDPPDMDNYERTILKLKEIGALLPTCKGEFDPQDGDITMIGKVMGSLPLDIRITKLILLGHLFDVLEETIIMGCAMSVRALFSEPFQQRLESYNNKLLWADSSESDPIAYLNVYQVWRQNIAIGKFCRSTISEMSWAQTYMVQIKHLIEVAKQEEDIKKRLKFFNIQVVRKANTLWSAMEKPLILKLVLAGAFYPNYYYCNAQDANAECEAVKMLSGHSPYNAVYFQNMPHPAPIYIDQVRAALKKCGISEDVQLSHDISRKLIVIFKPGKPAAESNIAGRVLDRNIPGEIVMPVYRAIKLRQLNIPIKIKLYSPEQVKEQLNQLTMHPSSSFSSEHSPAIGIHENHIELEITHVVDAGHFFGHRMVNLETLQMVYQALNQSHLRQVSHIVLDDVIYAAPFQDVGEPTPSYYRARIISYKDSAVNVFFIDYGNTTTVKKSELRELANEDLRNRVNSIPPFALECVLAEVGPNMWSNQWPSKATDYVKSRLLNKRWYAEVYSYVNGIASLIMTSPSIHGDPNSLHPSLNKELINKEYGRPKEESFFSKMNNQKRKNLAENGELNPSLQDPNGKSFEIDLKSLPTTSTGKPFVDLKGPHSPLEMKLFSMLHCSSQREVKVEWNSVNSVLLDSNPMDLHERLLVAGSVSQSADGRKLTLNQTTVLPNMHGLAALVLLIFAPTVELRTDDNYSRYTGALCGLGMDQVGKSLFPENDIELNFDVEFKDEDLLNINKLRFWMNERFCGDDALEMPDGNIIRIQKNLKDLVIKLLKPERHTIKKYYCTHSHRWGQVPKHKLYSPIPDADANMDMFTRSIYRLHNAIEINPENDRKSITALVDKLSNLMRDLAARTTPAQLKCELCDCYFEYVSALRIHCGSDQHNQLVTWLKNRAKTLNIKWPENIDKSHLNLY